MKDVDPRLRHLFWFVAELFAAVVSALALLLIIVRLALPHAAAFKPQVEAWVSQALGETARIGAVRAHWPGLDLTVVLDDVVLLDPRGLPRAEFARAHVSLDLLTSLWRGELTLAELHLDGLQVSLFGDVFAATADPSPPVPVDEGGVAPDDFGWFLPWLLSQPQIDVTSGQLFWHGPVAEAPQFNTFSLRTRNRGGHHTLAMRLDTRARDGAIDLAAEFDGASGSPETWTGRGYLRGRRVQWLAVANLVERLYPGVAAKILPVDDALGLPELGEFELWADARDGQVVRVAGEAGLSDPRDVQLLGIERVATRFDWRQRDAGWELAVDGVEVDPVGGGRFRTGPAALRYSTAEGEPIVEAGLASVDVAILHRLAGAGGWLGDERATHLDGLAPRGQLFNLRGRWHPGAGGASGDWRLLGEAWDITLNPWQKLPGIERLRVDFDVGPQGGEATLFGRNTVVTLPELFREPLVAERLSGSVRVSRHDTGWRLHADDLEADNAHIATRTRLDALLPDDGGAPFVDLEVSYRDGDAAEAWRYLPAGMMSKAVVAWLDRALVGGRVVRGGMLLHGTLDRFPFDAHDGRFQVRFRVEEMTLDYLEGWPRIEALGAWATFDGRGMRIDADDGRILGAALGTTIAETDDLTAQSSRLRIDGSMAGNAGDGLRYLRESPLRDRFGDYLSVADASGHLDLELDLDIELASGTTGVAGTIDLDDTSLDLPAFGIQLDASRGRLEFTNATLSGRGLKSTWRGMPIEIDVQVPDDPEARRQGPRITARGRADAGRLAEWLPAPLASRLVGELPWEAVIAVRESSGGQVDAVSIQASSDLVGLAVELPPPLGKPATRREPMRVEATLPATGHPRLNAAYGPLALVAELRAGEEGLSVPRATLGVGVGAVALPEAPVWQVDLRGEQLLLEPWRAVIDELAGEAQGPVATPSLQVNAHFGRVPLGESLTLHEVDARITGGVDAWQVGLDSREASGVIQLPRAGGREEPILAQLERVTLAYEREPVENVASAVEPQAPDTATPDPRALRGLRLGIDSLVVNGEDLGAFTLHAEPVAEGLRLSQVALDSPDWILAGTGRWDVGPDGATSTLDLGLETSDFNRLGRALFGEGDLAVRETHFRANLSWPGAPHHLRLAELDGSLHGRMIDGVLTEVEPGIGRLFSLVNLRTLGRRLSLDFSDLFDKGARFDTISGSFHFRGGDAFTNDLLIETPAATVNIMGRTGLVSRDYDQLMTVLPNVSGALPIAGAVLGGPAVGAALLLFNEVFSDELGQISRVQYRITGPWEAPRVESLARESTAPATESLPEEGR